MSQPTHTAFQGQVLLARGPLPEVARAVHAAGADGVLIFEDATGRQIDLDLRGSADEVAARYAPVEEPRGRGRPRLGVSAREVTLLPAQWDWLSAQPGGASATLRRLVEAARRDPAAERRAARDAAYRFMSGIAGDLPGFEEASRALYAEDRARLEGIVANWPTDVREHLMALLGG